MQKREFVVFSLLLLHGCATPPDKVTAAKIPPGSYSSMDCASLTKELDAASYAVASLSQSQNEAAMGDAVGVLLLGVPVSSALGGDMESELSLAKGKADAIKAEMSKKACPDSN